MDSPEFQAALNEACEKQFRGFLYGEDFTKAHSKDSIADTMEGMQRQREAIEAKVEGIGHHAEQVRREARIMSNPHMREITETFKKRHSSGGLVCPMCGAGDHGNRMNGKPVCMMNAKHNGLGPILLMTPEKGKDWKPPAKKFKIKESWELDDGDVVTLRGKKKRRK